MNNAEKARALDKIAKQVKGAASAFRHGRSSTDAAKLGDAWDGMIQVKLGRVVNGLP